MDEKVLDKTEHIERELAYQKLCEFEKNHCEDIYMNNTGSVVYGINATRLAELENIEDNYLKDLDFLTKENLDFQTAEFPSYQKLFEAKYKNRFLKNLSAISPNELQKKLGIDTLEVVAKGDNEIKVKYAASIKEVDLDNDGVPDRIDIDDTKNSVQTVADLDIVKNLTNKETSKSQEKKQKDDIER
ncbi:hypothetical protein [Lysinibacillus xylanilyticus]|uniref:hypothetical protein n=1 Tax=Lysinibacillus xylanilyticus TaxID=582475 RepID=UPI003CFC6268